MNGETSEGRLGHYLELFDRVRARVTDESTAVAILEQVGKDFRVEKMMQRVDSRSGNDWSVSKVAIGDVDDQVSLGGELPATDKQLGYLKALGVKVPEKLSKLEASRLIDEAQAKVVAV